MSEGTTHKHLKEIALLWMKIKVTDMVCSEVPFNNIRCIADVIGLNFKRKEVRVIEVKASKSDFLRDDKLFSEKTTYFNHTHYCYIMCPKNVILAEEVPYGYGLLWVDDFDNVLVVKKPKKNTKKLSTLFDTTWKITSKVLTNQMLFKDSNIDNRDETGGFFSRKSKIKMISFKCYFCKKTQKDLIDNTTTTQVICSCGETIELSKVKTREITGFNNKFIKKINKLT